MGEAREHWERRAWGEAGWVKGLLWGCWRGVRAVGGGVWGGEPMGGLWMAPMGGGGSGAPRVGGVRGSCGTVGGGGTHGGAELEEFGGAKELLGEGTHGWGFWGELGECGWVKRFLWGFWGAPAWAGDVGMDTGAPMCAGGMLRRCDVPISVWGAPMGAQMWCGCGEHLWVCRGRSHKPGEHLKLLRGFCGCGGYLQVLGVL